MKKIGFVVPWYGDNIPGGAEAALRGVSDHLFLDGEAVEILTTCVEKFASDWNQNYYKPGDYKSKLGIPIKRFKVRKRDVKAFDEVNAKLIAGAKISREEEETFNREMVNSDDLMDYMREHYDEYSNFVYIPYMFGTCYHGCKNFPEKSVMIPCFHDEAYAHFETYAEAFSKVKGMLFNARPEMELANKLYDLSQVKCEVMGLGLDTDFESDAARFREKFKIEDDFILYAGRKEKGKNVDSLLAYFDKFKQRVKMGQIEGVSKNLKLVLIGGGQIEIPKGVADDVIDLGFVDIQDKYDAYGAAALLCQPSMNESFSFVIMESWLAGRPVLVHENCEVTADFVRQNNGGLYFASYTDFEGTVAYLLKERQISDAMGENGKKFVKSHFAWDIIVDRYKKFLD